MKTLTYTPSFWDTTPGAFTVGAILGVTACLTIAGLCMVIWPESILSFV
jgi:hypothetical protein